MIAVRDAGEAGFAILTGSSGEGAAYTESSFGADGFEIGARTATQASTVVQLEQSYGIDLDRDGSIGPQVLEVVFEAPSVSVARLATGGYGLLADDGIIPLLAEDGTPWSPHAGQVITEASVAGGGYSVVTDGDAAGGPLSEVYGFTAEGAASGVSAAGAGGPGAASLSGAGEPAGEGPTSLLVKFAPGASAADMAAAASAVGGALGDLIRGESGLFGPDGVLQALSLGAGVDADLAIAILNRLPGVEYAEPNWTVSIEGFSVEASSNDPYFTQGNLWGMYGDDTSPTNAYGSQAADAWLTDHTGSMSSVVGVIDTGIDPTHVDLYLNIWLNQEEIPADILAGLTDVDGDGLITFRDLNHSANAAYVVDVNANGRIDARDLLNDSNWADGVDSDGNGFADDFYGWDFVNNDNDPFDDHGHGTHVAGTIGGLGNNGTGVAGVSWDVQMMALKFLSSSGSGDIADAVQAADYFTYESSHSPNQHFVATNNSWGGGGFSQSMLDAITRGAISDILFTAAAGNGHWFFGFGLDNDSNAHYPSNYDTSGSAGYDAVIAVASIMSNGSISSFSNYGDITVDLGAPGSGIISTTPGDSYASYSGTSMATPHVTGALALAASINPGLTAEELRAALLANTEYTSSLAGITVTDGRLNVDALAGAISVPGPTQTVVIASADDDAGTVQGSLASGAATDDTTPTLAGTLSAELQSGETLEVYRDGSWAGTALVSGTAWTFALATLAEGTHSFAARVEDASGGTGAFSASFGLTVDLTAPAVSIDPLVTNDTTPTLTGSVGDADATVEVIVGSQTLAATNHGDGTWTVGVPSALGEGTYDVAVTATDPVGNAGSDSTAGELVIDTTAPEAPTVDALTTSDTTPTVTGGVTLADGEALTVLVNGISYGLGSGLSMDGSVWSLTVNEALADGTYEVSATVTDAAGNAAQDASSNELVIDTSGVGDTVPPSVISIAPADAVLSIGESTTMTFSFSEAVSGFEAVDVDLSGAGGGTLGALSSNDGGVTWTGTFTPAARIEVAPASISVTSGSYSDLAGNPGGGGSSDGFTIDTLAPSETPGLTSVGAVASGVEVTGTVGALASDEALWVLRDGAKIGEAVPSGGDWSFVDTSAVAGVTYSYSALVEDGVGNQGPQAESFEYTVSSGDAFIFGTEGSDTLVGTDGAETISGLPDPGSGSTANGAGTVDVLNGNGGADLFVLGDTFRGVFYDDGNPKAGNNGKSDYAQIEDFVSGVDQVQLVGSSADYLLAAWNSSVSGTGIFVDSNGNGSFDKRDELTGVLVNADHTTLDLNSQDFLYV